MNNTRRYSSRFLILEILFILAPFYIPITFHEIRTMVSGMEKRVSLLKKEGRG